MKNLYTIIIIFIFYSCTMRNNIEKWKEEIKETEHDFALMVQKEGVEKAFLAFADEKAVLSRNNNLVIGKNNLKEFFKNQSSTNKNIQLTWKPDFIDVSKSGDLGYTYGKYLYSYTDSSGKLIESTGVFHTVWKKQENSTWKFVWD